MDQWAFFDELKAGRLQRVYVFYGSEAYIRRSALEALDKKLLMPGLEALNKTVLTAPSVQEIIESSETLPMMSDHRLVIVRDFPLLMPGKGKNGTEKESREQDEINRLCAYLEQIPESTVLVFEAGETLDKRKKLCAALLKQPGAVSFETLDDKRLAKWIHQTLRERGKRMEPQACQTLIFISGRELNVLHGEIEKLAAYAGEKTEITAADVEAVATHTAECTVFGMVDAIGAGRAKEAFRLLGILLGQGEQRIGILALITRHYRQLMYLSALRAEQRTPQEIAAALGVSGYIAGKLGAQLGKRNYEQMNAQYEMCLKTDYDIKRGAIREDAALEKLMLQLMRGA